MQVGRALSLYKILFHFKALLWEPIILSLTIPGLTLHRPPPLYAIQHPILVMAISSTGQVGTLLVEVVA